MATHFRVQKRIEHRFGFTLIELLVAMAIIGVMVGMVLFTLAGARQDALEARTRSTIEKLNAVILERWESYRYKSVKLNIPRSFTQRNEGGVSLIRARDTARLRTILLRDMMRMDMPDQQDDLLYPPTNASFVATDNNSYNLNQLGGRYVSSDFNTLRQYFGIGALPSPYPGAVVRTPAAPTLWTEENQSAECLYAIVAHSTIAGGSALENFVGSEISDTDGDTFPEFIDAWGNPIGWIRWPAAYNSGLNLAYKADGVSPDAFDPLRTDVHWGPAFTQKPWTLVPLIISSGADENFGVSTVAYDFAVDPQLSCFMPDTDLPEVGAIVDADAATDNVTNHDILLQ